MVQAAGVGVAACLPSDGPVFFVPPVTPYCCEELVCSRGPIYVCHILQMSEIQSSRKNDRQRHNANTATTCTDNIKLWLLVQQPGTEYTTNPPQTQRDRQLLLFPGNKAFLPFGKGTLIKSSLIGYSICKAFNCSNYQETETLFGPVRSQPLQPTIVNFKLCL